MVYATETAAPHTCYRDYFLAKLASLSEQRLEQHRCCIPGAAGIAPEIAWMFLMADILYRFGTGGAGAGAGDAESTSLEHLMIDI